MSKVVGVIVYKVEVAISCCTFSIVCFDLLGLFEMCPVHRGKFLFGWWVSIFTRDVGHYCVCVSRWRLVSSYIFNWIVWFCFPLLIIVE